MKDQIQPHELCAYLPYKVEIRRDARIITRLTLNNAESFLDGAMPGKLLLCPLSDLAKEIVRNGMIIDHIDLLRSYCICDNDHAWIDALEDDWASVEDKIMQGPYHLIRILHEWHFDTFNLLGRGLAERKGEQ